MPPIDPLLKLHHELDLIRAGLDSQPCQRRSVYDVEPWRAVQDLRDVMRSLSGLIICENSNMPQGECNCHICE